MDKTDWKEVIKASENVPLEKAEIQEFLQTYPPDEFREAWEQLVKALQEVITSVVNQVNSAMEQLVKNPQMELLIVNEVKNKCLERQRMKNMKVIKNGLTYKKYLELTSR